MGLVIGPLVFTEISTSLEYRLESEASCYKLHSAYISTTSGPIFTN